MTAMRDGNSSSASPSAWSAFDTAVKRVMTVLGRTLPGGFVRRVSAANNYMQLGRWMREHDFVFPELVASRLLVLESVARRVAAKKVLYLEFGVFTGDTMRYWSSKLTNPESSLHGFDSFEGLPEAGGLWEKGQFDVKGKIPDIPDPRVRFFKGWFNDVLPGYTVPPHDVLVICLDADLYSSTIYVLRHLRPYIRPGTFLYFDELVAMEHEPRAIHEFLEESRLIWRAVCADRSLAHAVFECTGERPKRG